MMNDHEIAALAKGLVPFVREVIAPLAARLAELEARPIEKGEAGAPGPQGESGPPGPPGPQGDGNAVVSAELAEQIAGAVRLLHESPPLEQRNDRPPTLSMRVARIERDDDGNLVPIYEPRT